jgi:hypothetical protein
VASKIISLRVKQTSYLAGYFVLMLYTLSGLMFQGGMWLLAGALCWFGIVSRFSFSHFYRYYKKRLKETSFKTECAKREEDVKVQKGSSLFEP